MPETETDPVILGFLSVVQSSKRTQVKKQDILETERGRKEKLLSLSEDSLI